MNARSIQLVFVRFFLRCKRFVKSYSGDRLLLSLLVVREANGLYCVPPHDDGPLGPIDAREQIANGDDALRCRFNRFLVFM